MENLKKFDSQVYDLIVKEEMRQIDKIRLIASENYVTRAVLEASGTVLTNKYSEGYPGKRYYEGQQFIDPIEELAIERAKELFGADHANVQPYSGSPANLAVYLAFVKPGETVMGMALPHGGHLTHGSPVSITGKYFNIVSYELDKETGLLNYETIRELALANKPKMIIAGHSAYPRQLDFKKFREIADEAGAILFVDMAHFAGLVAAGAHPSPVPYADVVTTTTHKTLRGPRGGMILCKEQHKNAKVMAEVLLEKGFTLVTGGTDNHLLLIDLTNKNISGKQAAKALDLGGIVLNCNAVPYDKRKPFDPSGIRLGLAAVTSRGFKEDEVRKTASFISDIIDNWENQDFLEKTAKKVKELCSKFPPPGLD
jgi:glycine hydroxymethyltransferase